MLVAWWERQAIKTASFIIAFPKKIDYLEQNVEEFRLKGTHKNNEHFGSKKSRGG